MNTSANPCEVIDSFRAILLMMTGVFPRHFFDPPEAFMRIGHKNFFSKKINKINWFSHQIRRGLISVPDRIQYLRILLVRHDKFVLIKTITKGDSPPSLTPLLYAVFQTY